jgi:MoxR-like ATPase
VQRAFWRRIREDYGNVRVQEPGGTHIEGLLMNSGSTVESIPLGKGAQKVTLDQVRAAIARIILGKDEQIALALACLLARGHLLIEDLPGLGKTMLAQSLAKVLGLSFRRIQFTSDMLPADIVGVSVFRQERGEFEFQPGPVFSQLILADEVNRATPKTQSALLEAMEEHQVSVDGNTRHLPAPFFVVATQNPADQIGTFPLPESQLDRFLMRLELGYPNEENERDLLTGEDRRAMLGDIQAVTSPEILLHLQEAVTHVHLSEALVDYVQALVRQTRESPDIDIGLSPRGALALVAAAKAHAFVEHHSGVYPDDVQAVFGGVAGHRLKPASNTAHRNAADLCQHVLDTVAIP